MPCSRDAGLELEYWGRPPGPHMHPMFWGIECHGCGDGLKEWHFGALFPKERLHACLAFTDATVIFAFLRVVRVRVFPAEAKPDYL